MKEIRSNETEFRLIPENRIITGYALKFNKESQDLGGFVEVIDSNALVGVLERSDILALLNHDDSKVLARSTNLKGTLSLEIDKIGLKYSFNAPNTPNGNEVYDAIQRGDLRNSSFAFTVTDSGQQWERRGEKYIRKITQFDLLYDVSPVFRPAYLDTTSAIRSLDVLKSEERISIPDPEIIDTTPVVLADELELINIQYKGNTYNVELTDNIKDVFHKTDDERELNDYLSNLEKEVTEIKK